MPRDSLQQHSPERSTRPPDHAELAAQTGRAVRGIVHAADRRTAAERQKDEDTAEILLGHLRAQQAKGWVEGLPSRQVLVEAGVVAGTED